jgi:hypothetical protein
MLLLPYSAIARPTGAISFLICLDATNAVVVGAVM